MATLTKAPALCYLNSASGRTVTVSSAATGYPGSNLSTSSLTPVWRSVTGAVNPVNVDVDLGSAKDIDVIALLGFNGSDSATKSPVLSEASNFSSPEYNPGSSSAYDTTYSALLTDTPITGRHLIHFPGTTYNSRYARLTLSNSGNPDNYLKGSVLWVGPIWQPPGMDIGSEPMLYYSGVPGAQRAIQGWKISMLGLSEAESRKLLSILKVKLSAGRYLLVPHPTDTKTFLHEAIYCTKVGDIKRNIMPKAQNHWQVDVEFKEVED